MRSRGIRTFGQNKGVHKSSFEMRVIAAMHFAHSDRLLLEPLGTEHANGLFEPLGHPLVWEHIEGMPAQTVAELAEQFLRMASPPRQQRERWINYAVRRRDDGRLIGRVEATVVEHRAEVAYLFGPDHWGAGYATEAMLIFQTLLERDHGVGEFWATTSPRNERSIRLLCRLGYEQTTEDWPPLMSYDPGDLVFLHGESQC
jgi:RimJ/RimL family protein N-acetyltransferase